MQLTIIYDNEAWDGALQADWGFSCLVEAFGKKILFDTGAKGDILLGNMKKLDLLPEAIEEIFISHDHWDHTGGLADFLKLHPVKTYVPLSFQQEMENVETIRSKNAYQLHENIFSTGELEGIEQSLVLKTEKGLVIIVGCSHPGVQNILAAASQFGTPYALIGGLHGFEEYDVLKELTMVCPTHCTKHKAEIKERFPEKYLEGGAGKVITLDL